MSAIHANKSFVVPSGVCEYEDAFFGMIDKTDSSEIDVSILCDELRALSTKEQAERSRTFFKTNCGGYAEHDVFLGVSVPNIRKLASAHSKISLRDLRILLISCINEERLLALTIMKIKFENTMQQEVYDLYMNYIDCVNNWNLVDASAHYIVGQYLYGRDKSVLFDLAQSNHWWRRRIAIVSTFAYIKKDDFEMTLKLAKTLLSDKHDLINKAVGWMLREVGKRDNKILEDFLNANIGSMPRVTLRYAIELFDNEKRKSYLKMSEI